ncbi:unnamed protein product, partial [marine sediment metagenome]
MSCYTRWVSHAGERRRDEIREHEKQLEIAANANGYSINDPTTGIT